MKPTITYEELLEVNTPQKNCFVDVRSPKEYSQATIPGAVNIPILDNEARETIGTLYVNGHVEEAKAYGIKWASSQLPAMYADYQNLLQEYDELTLFCSRGGMRSSSIFSLLKSLGLPVSRLSGGYKAYRHYIVNHLDKQLTQVKFMTLYGLSGSGKTDILTALAEKGAHVLDLEGCANHRGSILGSIGLSEPHSQKTFESLLFEASRNWQPGDLVFTEGESKRIGRVMMPPSLYAAIQEGEKLLIEASLEKRVAQIHQDYVDNSTNQELISTLSYMHKVISPEKIKVMQDQLAAGEADAVIEKLLVNYYDPRYSFQKKEYSQRFTNISSRKTADEILAWYEMRE